MIKYVGLSDLKDVTKYKLFKNNELLPIQIQINAYKL